MGRAIFGADAARQEAIVGKLARDTGAPIDVARRVYQDELRALAREARVGYYLPVLAARHAQQQLGARRDRGAGR